jgi:hypothetical protein
VAHVLGLHHVDSTAEIMYPTATSRVAELGPGDRTGLHTLGTPAGCVSQPDPWWLRGSMVGTAARTGRPIPATGDDVAHGYLAASATMATDPQALHCDLP